MEWPKLSIKWKIFHWCFSLAIGILGFNYWYTTKLVQRSAGHAGNELQGVFTRYEAFERAIAHGILAATDAWARWNGRLAIMNRIWPSAVRSATGPGKRMQVGTWGWRGSRPGIWSGRSTCWKAACAICAKSATPMRMTAQLTWPRYTLK